MRQNSKKNSLLVVLLLMTLAFGAYFIYQTRVQQNALAKLVDQANLSPRSCVNNQPEQIIETVIHKTSPWGALQPQIKDTIVQVFSQIAEFNWLQPYQTPNQKMASGTGFFIDDQGYIITNAHVVDEAKDITIQIPSLGKERFTVKIVGISFDRDLALLKLEEQDLAKVLQLLGKINFLPIGDSDQLYRADQVMYQGFPLGQEGLKSTVGVVSGREKMNNAQFIQIDAAINPGCSGGPALNLNGEVIGVATLGVRGAQNVGYLIPSKELKIVLQDLYQANSTLIRKPLVGVLYSSTDPELNKSLGNPAYIGGIYVVHVYDCSMMKAAGIESGDVICSINGNPIDSYGDVSVPWNQDKISFAEYCPYLILGQMVDLVFYRQGVRNEISFKLEKLKLPSIRMMYPDFEKVDYEVLAGCVFMELTLNHVAILQNFVDDFVMFKNPKNQSKPRLVITNILPSSLAQRGRILSAGRLVKEINGQKVHNLAQMREALSKSLETGILKIKDKMGATGVFPIEKVLEQEQNLSYVYRYPISNTVQKLIDAQLAKGSLKKEIDKDLLGEQS